MAELRVMDALREKRSELSGGVSRLEQQLARHRGSLAHLDATMRLFDPDLLPALSSRTSMPPMVRQPGQVSSYADHDAVGSEDRLDIGQAQAEAVIQPHSVLDYLGRVAEAVIRVGSMRHGRKAAMDRQELPT